MKKRHILNQKNRKRKPIKLKKKTSGKNSGKKTLKQIDKGNIRFKKLKIFKKKRW